MTPPYFFTSDEHYGHNNVLKFMNRPWLDIESMNQGLIARHNAKVPKGGLTYHLGDMFWRTVGVQGALAILDQLNGQHLFVRGNHDQLVDNSPLLRSRFISYRDIGHCQVKGMPMIVLCHYAMRVWRGSHKGSWHLYGHSHGELPEDESLSFDVGVDANNYEPVSLEQVAARLGGDRLRIQARLAGLLCGGCGFCLDCLRLERSGTPVNPESPGDPAVSAAAAAARAVSASANYKEERLHGC